MKPRLTGGTLRAMWLPSGFRAQAEIEVRRSRFLATLSRTDDEGAARAAILLARREHPGARHHCSASIVEVPGARPAERSSDDGEPAGTAGTPMLGVLRGSGLTNATVVVSRWFGGVKLGTGGLARAYAEAVNLVVAGAPRVLPVRRTVYALPLSHPAAGRIQGELAARGVTIVDAVHAEDVTLLVSHDDDEVLRDLVAQLTRGTGVLTAIEQRIVEMPVTHP